MFWRFLKISYLSLKLSTFGLYGVSAGAYTQLFFSSVLACFKYIGSQLTCRQPYTIFYSGDFNSFYGLYSEVSASFWKSSPLNNAASLCSLASAYQLDTTETFMLPDITKIIALPKYLIPDVHFLHSILKNYPFFQHF